jgi:hypothetical protein
MQVNRKQVKNREEGIELRKPDSAEFRNQNAELQGLKAKRRVADNSEVRIQKPESRIAEGFQVAD